MLARLRLSVTLSGQRFPVSATRSRLPVTPFGHVPRLRLPVFVQLDCDAPRDDRFDGTIRRDRVASLDLSVVDSGSQRVMRTPRQIAKASEDYFLVSIQTAGTGRVRQDGREAALRPGDFALYDSTRPYQLEFAEPFQQLVLMLPGEQLRSLVRDTQRLTGTAGCGRQGAGQLLIRMLDTLRNDVDQLQPAGLSQHQRHRLRLGLQRRRTLQSSPSGSASASARANGGRATHPPAEHRKRLRPNLSPRRHEGTKKTETTVWPFPALHRAQRWRMQAAHHALSSFLGAFLRAFVSSR